MQGFAGAFAQDGLPSQTSVAVLSDGRWSNYQTRAVN
jgi:hypothetical protein